MCQKKTSDLLDPVKHHECDKSDMRILCAILNVTKVCLIKVVTVEKWDYYVRL